MLANAEKLEYARYKNLFAARDDLQLERIQLESTLMSVKRSIKKRSRYVEWESHNMSDLSVHQKSLLTQHKNLLVQEATLTSKLAGVKMRLKLINIELTKLNNQRYMTRSLAQAILTQQSCSKCGARDSDDNNTKVSITRHGPMCQFCIAELKLTPGDLTI